MTEQEFVEHCKLQKQVSGEANGILDLYNKAYTRIWGKSVKGIDYLSFSSINLIDNEIVYWGEEDRYGGDKNHHVLYLPISYLFTPAWLDDCIASMVIDKKQIDDYRADYERRRKLDLETKERKQYEEMKQKYETTTGEDMMIFTFGSNIVGRHGAGAALTALKNYGAIYGQGEGLQGKSYGIPTKDRNMDVLPLDSIKIYVKRFLISAQLNHELTFKITRIGTGLSNLKDEDIAPMFIGASDNCRFDRKWQKYLEADTIKEYNYWGTF